MRFTELNYIGLYTFAQIVAWFKHFTPILLNMWSSEALFSLHINCTKMHSSAIPRPDRLGEHRAFSQIP